MKKVFAIALIATAFVACNGSSDKKDDKDTVVVAPADTTVVVTPADTTVVVAPADTTAHADTTHK